MKTFRYVYGITLDPTTETRRQNMSTTEGQRVVLMNLGSLTEIRGDSINSGHRWSEKRKLSTCMGTSKKNCPCDLMMGCASADITDGTARKSIIRHSLMPMIPSESSIYHTNLGTNMCHTFEWLLINACNNEEYAKIWTRPHLDTLYLLMTPQSLPLYSFSTFY